MYLLRWKYYNSRVVLEHNHELSPTKVQYFRSNKNLEPHKGWNLMIKLGLMLVEILILIVAANMYENLKFKAKDCRDHINKVRKP